MNTSKIWRNNTFMSRPNSEFDSNLSPNALENNITIYVPPLLFVLGTFGNILTIFVMRTRTFKRHPIGFYYTGYSVSSLLTLYIFLGSEWMAYILNKPHIDTQADWICRIWQFISRVITYTSIWFVVAMTIDRYLIIWHRKRADKLCTLFMAKFAAVSIVTGLTVVSVHAMWTYELMKGCYFFHNDDDIHVAIWPWMSASCYSFIPLTLILVFDVLIFIGLCLKDAPTETANEVTSMMLTHATLMLSMIYFVLVIPPTVINIVDRTFPPSWLQRQQLMEQLAVARVIGHYMAWTNTVTVFYVCILFSKSFRTEFCLMLTSFLFKAKSESTMYELHQSSDSSGSQVETEVLVTHV